MLNFYYVAGKLVKISSEFAHDQSYINRNDFKDFAVAEKVATDATELTGCLEVSYGFNGDYYACGKVVKVSKSLKRVETSDGSVFYRRGLSGTWLKNQTWALVPGVRNERNPSF